MLNLLTGTVATGRLLSQDHKEVCMRVACSCCIYKFQTEMANKIIIYILVASMIAQPAQGWLLTVGLGALGFVAGPIVGPIALGAVGFGAGGIATGSAAASMMASYGGSVAAGSAMALAQSAGAAGIGLAGQVAVGAAGAAIGAKLEADNCEEDDCD